MSSRRFRTTAGAANASGPRADARGGRETIGLGDVVSTPGGEWHWHGAAPDHFMTHLSITEGATEWGEHVTDAEYDGEPA